MRDNNPKNNAKEARKWNLIGYTNEDNRKPEKINIMEKIRGLKVFLRQIYTYICTD